MSKLAGMTLNERLGETGNLDEFEELVRKHRFKKLVKLLQTVGLSEIEAKKSAEFALQQTQVR
jgi:hypothetical protein